MHPWFQDNKIELYHLEILDVKKIKKKDDFLQRNLCFYDKLLNKSILNAVHNNYPANLQVRINYQAIILSMD